MDYSAKEKIFLNVYLFSEQVKKSTNVVILNSLDIDIKNVTFHTAEGSSIPSKDISLNVEEETATIQFDQKLPVGRTGYLHFLFQGEINDKMKGLYRSKYTGYGVF